jgi:hypothetical protein
MVKRIQPHLCVIKEKEIIDATSDHESLDQEGSRHLKYRQSLTPKSILGDIWYESHGLHLLGAPIGCTHSNFQDSIPESILEEIWYGSRGLHLIGPPIRIFKRLEGARSESFSTRQEPSSTRQTSFRPGRALGNFTKTGRSSTLG